jgi:hypothetical protein
MNGINVERGGIVMRLTPPPIDHDEWLDALVLELEEEVSIGERGVSHVNGTKFVEIVFSNPETYRLVDDWTLHSIIHDALTRMRRN